MTIIDCRQIRMNTAEEINSKYSFSKEIFPAFTFFVIHFMLIFALVYPQGGKIGPIVFFGIALLLFDVYFIIASLKLSPRWTLSNDSLVIKNYNRRQIINVNEIDGFEANCNHSFDIVWYITAYRETIRISAKGEHYFLVTSKYSNIAELCVFLDKKVNQKTEIDFALTNKDDFKNVNSVKLNRFGIFVYPALITSIPFAVVLCSSITDGTIMDKLPLVICLLLLVFVAYPAMNYTVYGESGIQIKNAFIFWKNIPYSYSDILCARFYESGRFGAIKNMELTLKNYTIESFVINSVGEKNREILAQILRENGINIL